jgi:pyrroline-5-carboxylate reductase
MEVVVVGTGRIGRPLVEGCRQGNNEVYPMDSETPPPSATDRDTPDLVVLAVAPENEEKHPSLSDLSESLSWIRGLPAGIPTASISSLSAKELERVVGKRPTVRFMCSSAVEDHPTLSFYEKSGAPKAIEALTSALPRSEWYSVPSEKFDRYTRLLVISALHCALLARVEESFDLSAEEQEFLTGTLEEAQLMINANAGSPQEALQSAMTPGGLTKSVVDSSLFQALVDHLHQA